MPAPLVKDKEKRIEKILHIRATIKKMGMIGIKHLATVRGYSVLRLATISDYV